MWSGPNYVSWNVEVENIFSVPNIGPNSSVTPKQSLSGHRNLTSERVLNDKRDAICVLKKTNMYQQKVKRKQNCALK